MAEFAQLDGGASQDLHLLAQELEKAGSCAWNFVLQDDQHKYTYPTSPERRIWRKSKAPHSHAAAQIPSTTQVKIVLPFSQTRTSVPPPPAPAIIRNH